MEITDSKLQPRIIVEQARSRALESLRAGQVLAAQVVRSTTDQKVVLRMASREVTAHTQLSLKVGEKLLLRVLQPKNPLQLQVVREAEGRNPRVDAMRVAVANQEPVSRLMERLHAALEGRPANPAPEQHQGMRLDAAHKPGDSMARTAASALLSGTQDQLTAAALKALLNSSDGGRLQEAMERILSHRVAVSNPLTSDQLRKTLETSGLYLESNLATAGRPDNDLKASLLELLSRLRAQLGLPGGKLPLPASSTPAKEMTKTVATPQGLLMELFSRTEGSLARVLLNQLASLPQSDSNTQQWHFDLPLLGKEGLENFHLKIHEENDSSQNGQEHGWSVTLDFDMEPLGPVNANLVLQGGVISSYFTAVRPEGARRISEALPLLNKAFVSAGLTVGRMTASEGKIDIKPRPPYPLVDEKA